MSQHDATVDRVRELMGPGNPIPADAMTGAWNDERGQQAYRQIAATTRPAEAGDGAADAGPRRLDRPDRLPSPQGRLRRVLAPVAACAAVAGIVVGLTLADGSHPSGPGTGAPVTGGRLASSVPRFYVALTENASFTIIASVHSSQTGTVLSHVGFGPFSSGGIGIAAEPGHSGRAFLIYAGLRRPAGEVATWQLVVSPDGRSATLRRTPLVLVQHGENLWVEGVAISPDGSQLAALLEQEGNSLKTRAEIRVYSLTGGPTRSWTAPRDPGIAFSPAWTGSAQLSFVWQDHLYGSAAYLYGGSSEVRVLDTSAPGGNLLASTVIATGGDMISSAPSSLGFIQSAGAGSADSPVVVAAPKDTSFGGHGTETLQLVELSATGSILKVLVSNSKAYAGEKQEGLISASCQVLGVAADGAMLAESPNFGEIADGTFTPLPHSAGVFAAAW